MSIDRAAVRVTDETTGHRQVQVTVLGDDDTRDDVEHIEPFGFTSRPPDAVGQNGPDAVVVDIGDTSDHQVVIVIGDRRYRLSHIPAKGEAVLYDAFGHEIRMQSAGAVANCLMDAIGFKTGGVAGLTGTLVLAATPPLPAPPVPVPVLTVAFAGGIVTSVVPGAPWTVAVGSVFQAKWS